MDRIEMFRVPFPSRGAVEKGRLSESDIMYLLALVRFGERVGERAALLLAGGG